MSHVVFTAYNSDAAEIIRKGGIGVIRTDTLYGIIAAADNEAAVNRVFKTKQRTPTKSPIVLISSADQLFDTYPESVHNFLSTHWPGPVSIILPSVGALDWLTRGNGSIAYRLPADDDLRHFIDLTGPLIAPSANPEGVTPAATIRQAIDYFGDEIDFYIDGGEVDSTRPPSQLLRYTISTNSSERLR